MQGVLSEGPGAYNDGLGFSDVIIMEIVVSKDPIYKKKREKNLQNC